MAITNRRVFHEVLAGDVWVGASNNFTLDGNTSISVTRGYVNQIVSEGDNLQGPAAVDQQGINVGATFVTGDVLNVEDFVNGPADGDGNEYNIINWYGKESGKTTYSKETLNGFQVTSFSLALSRGAYAMLTANGTCRGFDDGTPADIDFDDMHAVLDGQSVGTPAYAARLWKPTSMTYNSIPISHLVDINISVTADVLIDYGDTDAVITAIDIVRWNVALTATIRDQQEYSTTEADIIFYMLSNPGKDLVVVLEGVGSIALFTNTLTIGNVVWSDMGRAGSNDYTAGALSGICQFLDGTALAHTLFGASNSIFKLTSVAP